MQSRKACDLHSKVHLNAKSRGERVLSTHHQFFAFPSALRKGYYKEAPSFTNPWSTVDRKEKEKKKEKKKSLGKKHRKESKLSIHRSYFFSHIVLSIPPSHSPQLMSGNMLIQL